MIPREIYLKKLRLLKDQDLIKVITGVRRSGKSTLLIGYSNKCQQTACGLLTSLFIIPKRELP